MSVQGTEGFNDWQRYTNLDGPLVISLSNHVVAGTSEAFGPNYVGNFPFLACRFTPNAGQFQLIFTFFFDSAQAQVAGQYVYQLDGAVGAAWTASLPALGPYVTLTIGTDAINRTISGFMIGTHRQGASRVIPTSDLLFVLSTTLAASQVLTTLLATYYQGDAIMSLNAAANGLVGEVQLKESLTPGDYAPYAVLLNTTTDGVYTVRLSGDACKIVVANQTAGALACTVSVIASPD